ncbi:tunicamycin resistance protein [Lunasporangiospora selenospora]|uniref:UDP-N-acetylglucosamine--dolichyl-phosphate N-acetylglucosaminephosphotransferase n=1 Tax=Lunasporangiospora selenospora TaxID=979761 RepID=A0A9P6FUN7_9FUNG|nr:tunicamycin resistance protein [Lunasporangiospora selenospora]
MAQYTLASLLILTTAYDPLTVNIGFAVLAGIITWFAVPALSEIFIKAGLKGMDLCKKSKQIIPESMGMVAGLIYLVVMFLFIPFPFMKWFAASQDGRQEELALLTFPHLKLAELLSALLSIQSMVFLGFADDVLDIRWRFKMPLPAIAAIPLLVVYWVNAGVTYIVVPIPLRPILGHLIDLGVLYYIYMGMVAIFCTHSINIMAGINGVEVGQSLVIAVSIALNDILFLQSSSSSAPAIETHLFSLYFILPFIGVSVGLFIHNRYPSRVFIGDTYCYFAGMTFAVVGILAHYSKTLLLFFIPQIFNFLLSAPQLFRLVPCPRHRIPRFNRGTGLMEPSRVILDQEAFDEEPLTIIKPRHGTQHLHPQQQMTLRRSASTASLGGSTQTGSSSHTLQESALPADPPSRSVTPPPGQLTPSSSSPSLFSFSPSSLIPSKSRHSPMPRTSLKRSGWICVKLLEALGLTQVRYDAQTGQRPIEMTNLTIMNLILLKAGPMSEQNLTLSVMLVQTICSAIAFIIRHQLVIYVYDVPS